MCQPYLTISVQMLLWMGALLIWGCGILLVSSESFGYSCLQSFLFLVFKYYGYDVLISLQHETTEQGRKTTIV